MSLIDNYGVSEEYGYKQEISTEVHEAAEKTMEEFLDEFKKEEEELKTSINFKGIEDIVKNEVYDGNYSSHNFFSLESLPKDSDTEYSAEYYTNKEFVAMNTTLRMIYFNVNGAGEAYKQLTGQTTNKQSPKEIFTNIANKLIEKGFNRIWDEETETYKTINSAEDLENRDFLQLGQLLQVFAQKDRIDNTRTNIDNLFGPKSMNFLSSMDTVNLPERTDVTVNPTDENEIIDNIEESEEYTETSITFDAHNVTLPSRIQGNPLDQELSTWNAKYKNIFQKGDKYYETKNDENSDITSQIEADKETRKQQIESVQEALTKLSTVYNKINSVDKIVYTDEMKNNLGENGFSFEKSSTLEAIADLRTGEMADMENIDVSSPQSISLLKDGEELQKINLNLINDNWEREESNNINGTNRIKITVSADTINIEEKVNQGKRLTEQLDMAEKTTFLDQNNKELDINFKKAKIVDTYVLIPEKGSNSKTTYIVSLEDLSQYFSGDQKELKNIYQSSPDDKRRFREVYNPDEPFNEDLENKRIKIDKLEKIEQE